MHKKTTFFSVFLAGILVLASVISCSQTTKEEESSTIKLAYANWSEGVAMTHLATVVLEEDLGYEVVTKMADVETVFSLLGSSEYDVFVDAWLPKTHGAYMDEYGSELEDLGVNVEEAKTGLVVPSYVNLNSIEDLKGSSHKIVGIGSGAGIMQASERVLDEYSLSVELLSLDEQAMTDSLSEAITKREPVVVTGWTPHWIHNRFDLKFLDDPKNVFGESDKIHTLARSSFTSDHPRASLFFERFSLSESELASLMDEVIAEDGNNREAVKRWIENNPQVVNRWTRGLHPERDKTM